MQAQDSCCFGDSWTIREVLPTPYFPTPLTWHIPDLRSWNLRRPAQSRDGAMAAAGFKKRLDLINTHPFCSMDEYKANLNSSARGRLGHDAVMRCLFVCENKEAYALTKKIYDTAGHDTGLCIEVGHQLHRIGGLACMQVRGDQRSARWRKTKLLGSADIDMLHWLPS